VSDTSAAPGPRWQTQCGIGVVLLLVAAALWFDTRQLPASPAVGVGPVAALKLVSLLVTALGIAHFVAAWRARAAAGVTATDRGNHTSLGIVLAALVGQILLLEMGGGFIVSSVWLFALTARGFGERIGGKLLAIGATLSVLVYLFFTKALSLALPAGPLERLIG
jgi:putative tricarboxylic transport membrane protein